LEYEDGEGDHTLVVSIEDTDGREIAKATEALTIPKIPPGQQLISNQIIGFRAVTMRKPGKVVFRIVWDGEEKQRVSLSVAKVTQPPSEQSQ